ARGRLLGGPEIAALPGSVPGGQVRRRLQTGEESTNVPVIVRLVDADGVVDVPGRLLPRVERHLLPGVVWLQDRHHPLEGVVAQGRADADPAVEPEAGRVVEERLEPLHRFAIVGEDRPATTDPAGAHHRTAVDDWSGLGADLLLDLTTEPVGVAETQRHLGRAARRLPACVGLPAEHGGTHGLALALVAVEVVDGAGRRGAE